MLWFSPRSAATSRSLLGYCSGHLSLPVVERVCIWEGRRAAVWAPGSGRECLLRWVICVSWSALRCCRNSLWQDRKTLRLPTCALNTTTSLLQLFISHLLKNNSILGLFLDYWSLPLIFFTFTTKFHFHVNDGRSGCHGNGRTFPTLCGIFRDFSPKHSAISVTTTASTAGVSTPTQQRVKHVSVAANKHAITEELLEAVISIRSFP
jgi:hypothetical protein